MPIDDQTYAPGEHPDLPPPPASTGVVGWLRANLFSSIPNTILTIVCFAFLAWIVPGLLNWAIFEAVWTGTVTPASRASRPPMATLPAGSW